MDNTIITQVFMLPLEILIGTAYIINTINNYLC